MRVVDRSAGVVVVMVAALAAPVPTLSPPAVAAEVEDVGVVVTDGPIVGSEDQGPLARRDIFVYRDGTLTRVTHNTYDADHDFTPSSQSPTLSPDGTQIAYVQCELFELVIGLRPARGPDSHAPVFPACGPHVMNVDGTGDVRVDAPDLRTSDDLGSDLSLDWGSAGEIAATTSGDLYAFTPAGATRLVSHSDNHYWMDPSWSGDGQRLAVERVARDEFGSPVFGSAVDIWTLGADGADAANITGTATDWETDPVWSPDGSEIAFVGEGDFGEAAVFTMQFDGTERHEVFLGLTYYQGVGSGGWSDNSQFLGVVTQDDTQVWRFGVVPRTNDQAVRQIFELPNNFGSVDWVGNVDSPPVALDQELTVPGDGTATVELVATDADGDSLTYQVLTQPGHGSLSGTAPDLVYTPAAGYEGADSFTWRATANGKSDDATVTITVTPPCTLVGTGDRDVLRGTPGDDVLCGLGAGDRLFGNGGNDVILGGAGRDALVGGPGSDLLDGGLDDDGLRGDEGADELIGGEGADLVSYLHAPKGVHVDLAAQTAAAPGMGKDTLSGFEHAFGSAEDDVLVGDGGENQLFGGLGDDTLKGGGGRDQLDGHQGKDAMAGGRGADALTGGPGKDTLRGNAGADICYVEQDGGSRTSCENKDDPWARAVAPGAAPDGPPGAATGVAEEHAWWWYLGDDDYLVLYDVLAAAQTSYDAVGSATWEANVCHYLGTSPPAAACDGSELKSIWKTLYQQEISWWPYNHNGCSVVVWDYGHHSVQQWKKRWKTTHADDYDNSQSIPWINPGETVYVEVHDPTEVGKFSIPVTCPA